MAMRVPPQLGMRADLVLARTISSPSVWRTSSSDMPEKKKRSPGDNVAANISSIVPSLRPLAKRMSSAGWSTMMPAFMRC